MNAHERAELLEIASACCDREPTDGQLQRLQQLLDGNAPAQWLWAEIMSLHAELFWQSGSHESEPASLRRGSTGTSTRSNSNIWKWATALAAMLVLGSALGIAFQRGVLQQDFFAGGHNSSVLSPHDAEVVAQVTGTRDSRWATEDNQQVAIGYGSQLHSGQKLQLVEGVAELTFETGVKVIVEAPIELDLVSEFESVLHQGKLTAAVPKGAEGFQVACRGLTLVDRGTEFGVSSDDAGETEVHVFNGLVEGHVKDSVGSVTKKVSWKTDDVVRFSAETSEFSDVDQPSLFVRSLSRPTAKQNGLLASEEFDYPAGPLGGHDGGIGWGGPWENLSAAAGNADSNGVASGSLAFEGVDFTGNRASISGQFNRIRRTLGTSFAGIFDSAGLIENQDGARLIGADGKTVYLGFVQQIGKIDDVFYGFELNRGDGNRNRVLCIGHAAARAWNPGPPRTPNKEAGVTRWSVTSEFNGSAGKLLEFGELGLETVEPVFIVVRIDFGAENRDRIQVFLNPDPVVKQEQQTAVVSGTGNFSFDRIGLANFEGDKAFDVDGIRIGTTWSAVAGQLKQTMLTKK